MAKADKSKDDKKEINKLEALMTAMGKIEKAHGKGAIMNMAEDRVENVSVISTGSISIDTALGVGGFPRGRIIEIYGPESSGKTTLAIHTIAQAQKQGGLAAIIDAEHAFDPIYAAKLGVDIKKLWISQPDNGEQALDIAEQLILSSAVDVVVIDSVAALTPKVEIEGSMNDQSMGLQARLMSRALRKLTGAISKSNTVCIFINQLREKIGGNTYGGGSIVHVTPGGNALKFYSSIRVDIRPLGYFKKSEQGEDVVIGRNLNVKISKNKLAPPFRSAKVELVFGDGISREGEIIDYGIEFDLIKKSGSWYSYDGSNIGQGKENVRQFLKDNPELADEITQKIYEKLHNNNEILTSVTQSNDDYEEDFLDDNE